MRHARRHRPSVSALAGTEEDETTDAFPAEMRMWIHSDPPPDAETSPSLRSARPPPRRADQFTRVKVAQVVAGVV